MHYSYEHTFSANGKKANEEEEIMECAWGILTNVDISFQWGTSRRCHVHIDETKHQIFPTNPNGNYAFEGYTLHITGKYELLPATRKIYLRGWNEGNNDHTIAVAFEVLPIDDVNVVPNAIDKLRALWEVMLYGR
jgi:hypothetical protein